jgi:hypothetical protein
MGPMGLPGLSGAQGPQGIAGPAAPTTGLPLNIVYTAGSKAIGLVTNGNVYAIRKSTMGDGKVAAAFGGPAGSSSSFDNNLVIPSASLNLGVFLSARVLCDKANGAAAFGLSSATSLGGTYSVPATPIANPTTDITTTLASSTTGYGIQYGFYLTSVPSTLTAGVTYENHMYLQIIRNYIVGAPNQPFYTSGTPGPVYVSGADKLLVIYDPNVSKILFYVNNIIINTEVVTTSTVTPMTRMKFVALLSDGTSTTTVSNEKEVAITGLLMGTFDTSIGPNVLLGGNPRRKERKVAVTPLKRRRSISIAKKRKTTLKKKGSRSRK